MDAELVLDTAGINVVASAERAVRIDEELRRKKQRDALRACRRAGQARENEMNDVVAHVMIAVGDEDFCAEQTIGAIGLLLRPRAERSDISARLWFGELHGARPFAGDQLFKIDVLQLLAAVRIECIDRTQRQQWA